MTPSSLIRSSQITLLAILSLCAACGHVPTENDITVRAGLIKKNIEGKFEVYRETMVIPLIPKTVDPEFMFGVLPYVTKDREFTCRIIFYIPKQNAVHEITESYTPVSKDQSRIASIKSNDRYNIIESNDTDCGGFMRFDENDIPGKYIVEIIIDGKSIQTIFDVQQIASK